VAEKKKKEKEAEEETEKTEPIAEAPEKEKKEEKPESKDEELKKLNDKYLRVVAEYDNYRKRTQREKESIYPEAKAAVTAKFLPVLDNMERALAAANESDPLYEGVRMILNQFDEALKSVGVEYIDAVGQTFDPALHNAVMHTDDDTVGENVIVEEFQKGYKIGDRIVRHSVVKVAN